MNLFTDFNAAHLNQTQINAVIFMLWQALITIHWLIFRLGQLKAANQQLVDAEYTHLQI